MTHVTYTTAENESWRAEDGKGVLDLFGIVAADLPAWHAVLAGEGRLFEVVRRKFALHRALAFQPEELAPQADAQIASYLTAQQGREVREAEVPVLVQRAVKAWEREKQRQANTRRAEAESAATARVVDGEDAESQPMRLARMNAKAEQVLRRFGFAIDDEADVRDYLVARVEELEPQLESEDDRVTVMQMLRNEVSLHLSVNPALALLQRQIREIVRTGESHTDFKSLQAKQEREKEMIATCRQLQTAIEEAKKSLALGESITGRGKMREQMQDTVSYLNESVRAWQADANHALIDGVHTAAEIRILTKGYGDRPAQYRIEPALMVQALIDGLHDKEFRLFSKAGVLLIGEGEARKTLRRLKGGLQSGLERMQCEEGPVENLQDDVEDAPGGGVAADAPVVGGAVQAPVMPSEEIDPGSTEEAFG